MRYEKFEDLIHLALEMQARRSGVSLEDIQERFSVGRRTAMRMKDSVMRVFPQVDEMTSEDRKKRWRIPTGVTDRLISFTPEELADLDTVVEILKRDNMQDAAANMADLSTKLRALLDSKIARRVEPDLEALLEAEGLAMRPGPKPRISSLVLEDLREAIKGCEIIKIRHKNRKTKRNTKRVVHPLGLIYGHRHYLLAFDEKAKDIRKFAMPNIEEVEITGKYFVRDEKFSIEEYTNKSFGVFSEEPFEVVWKFSPKVAEDVLNYRFHPDQIVIREPDGSVRVEFEAGGILEMAWHLYQWGKNVEVIKPEELSNMVHPNRTEWFGTL